MNVWVTPLTVLNDSSIAEKFVTGDYVGDSYHKTIFGANPPTGGFWANASNITNF